MGLHTVFKLNKPGEGYVAKTKEVSVAAYEGAKPYVLVAAEKTTEASKAAYAKLLAYIYPEEEPAFAEPSSDRQSVQADTQVTFDEDVGTEANGVSDSEVEERSEL